MAIDIFTGRKLEDLCPSTHNMDVPVVSRMDFQLLNISDDGFLSLMNESGDVRDDLRVPEDEIGADIKAKFASDEQILVTVLSACGEECAVGVKALVAK